MTLLEIRTQFVDLSGRYDLVVNTSTYADNGANFFIKAGQRYLDCILPNPNSEKVYRKDIAAGDHNLFLKHLRYVETVELFNADGKVQELTLTTMAKLRAAYTSLISAASRNAPTTYALSKHLPAPEQEGLTAVGGSTPYTTEFTYDHETLSFNAARKEQVGIEFRPVSDAAYTMVLTGGFFTLLDDDADTSYHSLVYPEVLIMAANMAVEAFYRNSTGVNEWEAAISRWLDGQDKNLVHQEIAMSGNRLKG